MKSTGGNGQAGIRSLIYKTVLIADAARPESLPVTFQGLWFPNAIERVAQTFSNQLIDTFEGFPVLFLPVQIVVPGIL